MNQINLGFHLKNFSDWLSETLSASFSSKAALTLSQRLAVFFFSQINISSLNPPKFSGEAQRQVKLFNVVTRPAFSGASRWRVIATCVERLANGGEGLLLSVLRVQPQLGQGAGGIRCLNTQLVHWIIRPIKRETWSIFPRYGCHAITSAASSFLSLRR